MPRYLSQLSDIELAALTEEQKTKLFFDLPEDDGKSADVAILLGSRPEVAAERADAAAELYLAGRTEYILPTGGVKWPQDSADGVSECDFMTRRLIQRGVPESAIIRENEARTTRENMILAALQLERSIRCWRAECVAVVSSYWHLRRALLLAEYSLPRGVKTLFGWSLHGAQAVRDTWHEDPVACAAMEKELGFLRNMIRRGMAPDLALDEEKECVL